VKGGLQTIDSSIIRIEASVQSFLSIEQFLKLIEPFVKQIAPLGLYGKLREYLLWQRADDRQNPTFNTSRPCTLRAVTRAGR
jgi:hypothetical protein